MLSFRDRDGRNLTATQWHKLYADPSYSIVKRNLKRLALVVIGEVVTTWMGVITSGERRKNLFLVERLEIKKSGNGEHPVSKVVEMAWAETEQQALEIHGMYERRL